MTNLTKMEINTGNSKPVSQNPYPIAMKHYDWVKNEINKLLDTKVIHSNHSSWSASIIVIPKGNSGKCLVIEYRTLNKGHPEVHPGTCLKLRTSSLNSIVCNIFQPWISELDTITYPLMLP